MEDYHLDFRNDPFVDLKIRQIRSALVEELSEAVRKHRRRSHLRGEILMMTRLLEDAVNGKTFALPSVIARIKGHPPTSVDWEVMPFKWCEL